MWTFGAASTSCHLYAHRTVAPWMQAWFCIDPKTGRVIRWCSTHKQWEPIDGFGGYWRTCLGRALPSTSAEALEAARIAAAVAAAEHAADAMHDVEEDAVEWNVEWGRQSEVVDGQDAVAQLRSHLGNEVINWAADVLGRDLSAIEEEDHFVQAAVEKLYEDGQATEQITATGIPVPGPPAPTTCAICAQYTCPAGFTGQSVCLPCAARGRGAGGLSLIDVNHALVSGLLYGKGTLPSTVMPWSFCVSSGVCGSYANTRITDLCSSPAAPISQPSSRAASWHAITDDRAQL